MADEYGQNQHAPALDIHHAALKRWSDESEFKVMCPACGDGLLLVQRDQETLQITGHDRCIRCAQLVRYRDQSIGGEPVAGVVLPPLWKPEPGERVRHKVTKVEGTVLRVGPASCWVEEWAAYCAIERLEPVPNEDES
jgi:hypothetical protein